MRTASTTLALLALDPSVTGIGTDARRPQHLGRDGPDREGLPRHRDVRGVVARPTGRTDRDLVDPPTTRDARPAVDVVGVTVGEDHQPYAADVESVETSVDRRGVRTCIDDDSVARRRR